MPWGIYNATDNIWATPDTYASQEAAELAVRVFRIRFRQQGYYRTATGLRIAPEDVELEVVPV